MKGEKKGLQGLIRKRHPLCKVIFTHCLIHQQALCAKTILDNRFPLGAVLKDFSAIVKFVRGSELRARLFQQYTLSKQSKALKLLYHSDIRWLSAGESSSRFLYLYDIICDFLPTLSKLPDNIADILQRMKSLEWKFLLSFFVDVTFLLNKFNKSLQGDLKCAVDLFLELRSTKVDFEYLNRCVAVGDFTSFPNAIKVIRRGFRPQEELHSAY